MNSNSIHFIFIISNKGTVRQNSKGMPEEVTKAKLKVGETVYRRKGEILAVAFREKQTQRKPAILLSTRFHAEDVTKEKRGKMVTKPALVSHYNKYMGGVDVSDKMVCHVAAERATHRYWVKVFRNMIDMSLLNAYQIYMANSNAQRKLSRHDFLVSVVESLCSASDDPMPDQPTQPTPQHRLILLPGKKEMDCVVYSDRKGGKRRRSRHWCPACQVGCHEKCEGNFNHPGKQVARRGVKRTADEAE